MRECWVCDIADYAKFGVLRHLAGPDLPLGVVWYLTTHASPNKPIVSYLSQPAEYAELDRGLFEELRRIRAGKGDAASLADIEDSKVFPHGTKFFREPLSTSTIARTVRPTTRTQWFEAALAATTGSGLVFLDPDTGLLPPARRAENKGGEEYATTDEVLTLLRRGQSVIIVQFGLPQNFEATPRLAHSRLASLSAATTREGYPEPWGIWWSDKHKVGLLIASCKSHDSLLRARGDALLALRGWSQKLVRL